MFKNAVEKINEFYNIDIAQNPHADEVFEVLSGIISFESVAIFYLSPSSLTLEFGKNFELFEDMCGSLNLLMMNGLFLRLVHL